MSKGIEDARALLGDHISILAADTRYDPGQSNLKEEAVRQAADEYALAVLRDTPGCFFNFEDEHICPEVIQEWLDEQEARIRRLQQ